MEVEWHPHLKVWARRRSLSAEAGDATGRGVTPTAAPTGPTGPARSGAGAGGSAVDVPPACGAAPDDADVCAICLDARRDTAYLVPCLHSFCRPCIERWATQSPCCPLCKRTSTSRIHGVVGMAEFSETVTTTAPEAAERREPRDRRTIPVRAVRVHARQPRWLAEQRARPRPLRVLDSHEATLRWRRSVYRIGATAVPFAFAPRDTDRVRARAAAWARRELAAFFSGSTDTGLVVEAVAGVCARHTAALGRGGGGVSSLEELRRDIAREMRGVLPAVARPFAAELVNFVSSPYSMAAYDTLVRYQWSPPRRASQRTRGSAADDGADHERCKRHRADLESRSSQ